MQNIVWEIFDYCIIISNIVWTVFYKILEEIIIKIHFKII